MERLSLVKLYKKFIKGTSEKSPVLEVCVHLCTLTNAVRNAIGFKCQKVYITTKIVKHLYDAKPAEEFEFLLRHISTIAKYPDHIYENKKSKRGNYCFVKQINKDLYVCSIEESGDRDPDEGSDGMIYVVTGFRLRKGKESYLNNLKLIWSWKGDKPSS